ncbi:MAG: MvaI/BcnI family restriction endonuclease [Armatimonadota bacterium]
MGELSPQPYWGFDDLRHKAETKLLNCFYVQVEVKKEGEHEFYHYSRIWILQGFSFDGFLSALEEGNVLVDFDARTGHNHGRSFGFANTPDHNYTRRYKKYEWDTMTSEAPSP